MKNSRELGVQYPSKPMSIYGTIWDASSWATEGGKYKVDYNLAPFVATYKELVLHGCLYKPNSDGLGMADDVPIMKEIYSNCELQDSTNDSPIFDNFLSDDQKMGLEWVRKNFMIYDYCVDSPRYPHQLPECQRDLKS
ncbi:hypothetical protein KP509_11G034100 [Ceratopteris richardii]|uniref:xyloglucan:xyloglucosyl transferase n=1 Tax=Ceratopteris richardii TaxID=49495 RepID=A0A8T2TNB1_CERRI|nr:hypothetical protein KP509_11G034100 [Ceratopteris richardii]